MHDTDATPIRRPIWRGSNRSCSTSASSATVPLLTRPCSTAQSANPPVLVTVHVITDVAARPPTTATSAVRAEVRSAHQPEERCAQGAHQDLRAEQPRRHGRRAAEVGLEGMEVELDRRDVGVDGRVPEEQRPQPPVAPRHVAQPDRQEIARRSAASVVGAEGSQDEPGEHQIAACDPEERAAPAPERQQWPRR